MNYHILTVICSVIIYVRSKKVRGALKTGCTLPIYHRVTLDCMMRDGLEKGVYYKQDVHVSPRDYGNTESTSDADCYNYVYMCIPE